MSPRRLFVIVASLGLAMAGIGGAMAQMESGDRGILPLDSSNTLEIGGIHVDVGGKDAAAARYAGWRVAQREGFEALWSKMHDRPANQAPNLSDSTLDTLVSSIVIEREEISPGRYIADLGVLFDRARAGELLGVAGVSRRSAPMLLIPITVSGGTMTSVETRNAWQRAWAQFRTSSSTIDYVRVSGLGVDPLLINAAQTRRPGRAAWRNIVDLYGAADVLGAEVQLHRLYPGGPARARFIARHGPDGDIIGGFDLETRDGAALPRMMADGVERMDALFAAAFAAGRLQRDPTLIVQAPPPVEELVDETLDGQASTVIRIQLPSLDAASLGTAIGHIRSVDGVEGVREETIAIGGWSMVSVTLRGDISALRAGLMARGWVVDDLGGVLRMSRGASAPAPSPSP